MEKSRSELVGHSSLSLAQWASELPAGTASHKEHDKSPYETKWQWALNPALKSKPTWSSGCRRTLRRLLRRRLRRRNPNRDHRRRSPTSVCHHHLHLRGRNLHRPRRRTRSGGRRRRPRRCLRPAGRLHCCHFVRHRHDFSCAAERTSNLVTGKGEGLVSEGSLPKPRGRVVARSHHFALQINRVPIRRRKVSPWLVPPQHSARARASHVARLSCTGG